MSTRDPVPLDAHVQRRFQLQGRRNTAPELAIRRLLHGRGLRYRVDRAPLPGMRSRADLVFGPSRVAVFVDGCFWHRCPQHGTSPKNNADWWNEKLAANTERDRRIDAELAQAGWEAIRVWEHEDPGEAAARIAVTVQARRPT